MEKQKIDEEFLEKVAGGVVSDGPYSVSYSGGRIVMAVDGQPTSRSYSEGQFMHAFTAQGIPSEKAQELVDLIKSDQSFSPQEVKEATGIDFAFTKR